MAPEPGNDSHAEELSRADQVDKYIGTFESRVPDFSESECLSYPSEIKLPGRTGLEEPIIPKSSYTSFGGEGTTATVNSGGFLIQISRYLGIGQSGFLGVNHQDIFSPYYGGVQPRAFELFEAAEDPTTSFGLVVDAQSDQKSSLPQLDFIHDRWPRFTYKINQETMKLQYTVHQDSGTIIQDCVISKRAICKTTSEIQPETKVPQPCAVGALTTGLDRGPNGAPDQSHTHASGRQDTQSPKPLMQDSPGLAPSDDSRLPLLKLNTSLQINDLHCEWVPRDLRWPDEIKSINNGYSIVIAKSVHPEAKSPNFNVPTEDQARESENRDAAQNHRDGYDSVALVIATFVDGKPLKFSEEHIIAGPEIDLNHLINQGSGNSDESRTLCVTVAYRLLPLKNTSSWEDCIIKAKEASSNIIFSQALFKQPHFSENAFVDFIIRRNLEHILSVCSIPIEKYSARDKKGQGPRGGPKADLVFIAFTCGDMSGHAITAEASFLAFRFLLSLRAFCDDKKYEMLTKRVRETCAGHLARFTKNAGQQEQRQDSADQRDDGKAKGRTNPTKEQHESAVSTAIQLAKATDFIRLELESSQSSVTLENLHGTSLFQYLKLLKSEVENWIGYLRQLDDRDYHMFPRGIRQYQTLYRLDDHAWIWYVRQKVEFLHYFIEDSPDEEVRSQDCRNSMLLYGSSEFLEGVKKRFTATHPKTGQRLLALWRTKESGGLLSPERAFCLFDSYVPFHAELLQPILAWANILKVRSKEPNEFIGEVPTSTSSATCGINLITATYGGKTLRSQSSRRKTNVPLLEALTTAVRSCLSCGVFPGCLDDETKTATCFAYGSDDKESRDDYWGASFLMAFAFCEYSDEIESVWKGKANEQPEEPAKAKTQVTRTTAVGHESDNLLQSIVTFKKPHEQNNLIDATNIVEVPDEWLHECPDFLHFGDKNKLPSERRDQFEAEIQKLKHLKLPEVGVMYKVRKGKNHSEVEDITEHPTIREDVTPQNIGELLLKWRMEQSGRLIKKKLFWITTQDAAVFPIFGLASPDSDQPGLDAFFEHYKSFDKHFFDDTDVFGNKWVTEFQLSFYKLEDTESSIIVPELKETESCIHIPELNGMRITRGRVGFRINGDFFDRYWVCHVLGLQQKDTKDQPHLNEEARRFWKDMENPIGNPDSLSSEKEGIKEESTKRSWQQRKVLELLLLDEMISDVIKSSEGIFSEVRNLAPGVKGTGKEGKKEVKKTGKDGARTDANTHAKMEDVQEVKEEVVGEEMKQAIIEDPYRLRTLQDNLTLSKVDKKDYFDQVELWETMQQVLRAVEDDLEEILTEIASWESREQDRGKERPRWTEKDEKRYRPAIRKMTISNAQKIRQLKRVQANLRSLREILADRRDQIRDDLNLRGAEDTRYFTYATVVFLPLGFGASVFSMGAAPSGDLIFKMSMTSLITLALTCFALILIIQPTWFKGKAKQAQKVFHVTKSSKDRNASSQRLGTGQNQEVGYPHFPPLTGSRSRKRANDEEAQRGGGKLQ